MSSLSHQDPVRRGAGPSVPVIMRLPDLHQRAALKAHDPDSPAKNAEKPRSEDPHSASTEKDAKPSRFAAWKASAAVWAEKGVQAFRKHPRYAVGGVSAVAVLGICVAWSGSSAPSKAPVLGEQSPAVVQLGPEAVPGAPRKSIAPSILSPVEPKQTLVSVAPHGSETQPPSMVMQPPSVLPPPDSAPRQTTHPAAGAAPLATTAPRKPGVARLTGKIIDRDNAPIEARHEPNRQGIY